MLSLWMSAGPVMVRRLRFHQNVLEECQRLEKQHYQVVLVGDMNIAPARTDGHPNLRTIPFQYLKNRADFNHKFLCDEGRDIDAFRALHNSQRKYTHNPGRGKWGTSCDRVDLIVAARILMDVEAPAIVGCDFEDIPEERGHGDHVPLWASIDVKKLNARSTEAQEEWDSKFLERGDSSPVEL